MAEPRREGVACSTCGGTQDVVREEVRVVAGCCGNYRSDGQCCGDPAPVPDVERWQEPCPDCAPPEAWGGPA